MTLFTTFVALGSPNPTVLTVVARLLTRLLTWGGAMVCRARQLANGGCCGTSDVLGVSRRCFLSLCYLHGSGHVQSIFSEQALLYLLIPEADYETILECIIQEVSKFASDS